VRLNDPTTQRVDLVLKVLELTWVGNGPAVELGVEAVALRLERFNLVVDPLLLTSQFVASGGLALE
jgi:hypothetical protein